MKNNGNCKFEVKRVVGHKIDGTPIRKSFYGKSKREAKQKAEDYIINHVNDSRDPGGNITFQELYDDFYAEKSNHVRDITLNMFRTCMQDFLDEFGKQPVSEITKKDIQKFTNSLSDKYAYKTISMRVKMARSTFNYAIENGILTINPCNNIKYSSNIPQKSKRVYTEEEVENILKYTYKLDNGLSVNLMLSYGTTISETLGIKYSDIDFKAKTIHIARGVTYSQKNIIIDEPKNVHRKRYIAVSQKTLDLIKKVYNPEFEFLINDGVNKDKPYYPTLWRSQIYNKFMKTVQEKLSDEGIDISILSPHELRHTRASIWVDNDVNLFAIAEEMGWSSLDMLRKVYGHPSIQKVRLMLKIDDE